MREVKLLFPKGRSKALTLSYDDGVQFDKRLVEIFNKYNLKATFNVNSGVEPGSSWVDNGVEIVRMNLKDTVHLYKDHEIAIHSLTHPDLQKLNREEIIHEILEDKKNLEEIYGGIITGMAYPFGTYDDKVVEILKEVGVEYSRAVNQHENFTVPEDFLKWNPTCHHINSRLMDIAKTFLEDNTDDIRLFYVWGHSYEFAVNDNWEVIEEFADLVSNKEEIWYGTNMEICSYITAFKKLKFSQDKHRVYNPTALDIWIKVNDDVIKVKSGDMMNL